MRLVPLLLFAACAPDQPDDSGPHPPTWHDIGDLAFAAPEDWARPIDDYIAANAKILGHEDFLEGVHELYPFEERLYLGYGDANLNLGRNTPIELRYWEDIEAPETVASEFTVDEEQVDHFRLAGQTLLLPGVDATEDDLLGNVYLRPAGGDWSKSRTLQYAWHVHDAAALGETLWACGSGGTLEDYDDSDVNAYLWRSDDGGVTFDVAVAFDHPDPPGDNRFTNLAVVGGVLHVFGYASDLESINQFHAFTLGEDGLQTFPGLSRFYVTATAALSEDRALLVGVSVGASVSWKAKLLHPDGAEDAEAFAGLTVLDLLPLGGSGTLVLSIEGDAYPSLAEGPWQARLDLTQDGTEITPLLAWETESWPESAAFFHDSLLIGTSDGSVLRARGG